MKKTLCAVFFDVDDTLYSTTEFAALARRRSAEAMRAAGINLPTEKILKELNEVVEEFTSNYEHHYDKLLLRIPRSSSEGINPALIVAAGVIAYHETKSTALKPYPDALAALKRLSETSLIRGVITAGLQIKQAEKLIRLGIHPLFSPNAIFISDQIGVGKPNPKLYLRACDEVGVRPGEAIYVGDNPLTDIDPANAVGMITVLFRRGGKYSHLRGRSRPTYSIENFRDLTRILQRDFRI
ncbi:MAG: hypothetical protein A2Z34_06545 [Planctomycetes bacterium RBG_16_59_8]|nr:MAG: hypothetical protein A2Z34_06545 [Planctomycetes bacterium RBG_16_59_8]